MIPEAFTLVGMKKQPAPDMRGAQQAVPITPIQHSVGVLNDTLIIGNSANKKTGHMPVTYRPMTTCPPDCVFLPSGPIGGCYGTGRIFAMADRRAMYLTIAQAISEIQKSRPTKARVKYLRDRVVGDVITPDMTMDRNYLQAISDVARHEGLIPFGYTHAWRYFTRRDVQFIKRIGYVMNASCETVEDVEVAVSLGLLPTIVDNDLPEGAIVAGYRVVTCPAQTRDEVTCASCGLCAKAQRKALVRFRIHGTARNKAIEAVEGRRKKRKAA